MIKLYCDRCGTEIPGTERPHVKYKNNPRRVDTIWIKVAHTYSQVENVLCLECAKREASEFFQMAIAEAAEKLK